MLRRHVIYLLMSASVLVGQQAEARQRAGTPRIPAEPKAATSRPEAVQPATPDPLLAQFRAPPDSSRPRVWWHWLSGNVSKDGITRDFEWMKRIGIAGAMMFDGDTGAPKIVPERITVRSPAWYDHLRVAAAEAERLGLEFSMAAAPGWSETGGPWITPDMGMKKFVWTETRVRGGTPAGKLAPLPDVAGPFQSFPAKDPLGRRDTRTQPFSRDVKVFAYPAPAGDIPLASLRPSVTASDPALAVARLTDGDLDKVVRIVPVGPGQAGWVRFDFARPATMRALTYVGELGGRSSDGPAGRIEASDDGVVWRSLRTLTGQAHAPAPQRTFAFPETTASHFRIVFDHDPVTRNGWPRSPGIDVAELALVPGARVDLFEDRAGFGVVRFADAIHTPRVGNGVAIARSTIIDLTDRLRADGTLDWKAPKGDWIILRTGYSLTGERNHPATPEGTGLEVDKLNAAHVRAHLDAYLEPVIKALGPDAGRQGLRNILTDSWEAGQENWTEGMIAEFRTRRGYDPTPYLPVLAGRVVDSAERSDAFLWDFRRTLADLVADNHYGTITGYAKEHGLGFYGEATGAAWPTVADGMLAKSRTDIPMGEFWAIPFGGEPADFLGTRSDEFPADIIETRSTANVYGKPLVAAEALTSSLPRWNSTPWNLKWVADKYMAMGVNLLVLHTSPHQPTEQTPGLSLAPFGQVFTRHETWGEMARPWIDYLARNSFLLQQGEPVADVLYFYGEGAPSGVPYDSDGDPANPVGHGFDYVNADALLRLARVENGQITFPGGAAYRVLVLPADLHAMTLPLISKIRDLVAAGAVITGSRPVGSPSLADDPAAVRTIADQLWGQTDGHAITVNSFGSGRVYAHRDVADVLAAEAIERDFDYTAPSSVKLVFNHRRTAFGDVYFVSNQSNVAATVQTRFRVTGHRPELWDAVSGNARATGFRIVGHHTEVPLTLAPYQSVFVVFRRPTSAVAIDVAAPRERVLSDLDAGWTVRFPGQFAPKPLAKPGSWTTEVDPAIRYHSGTASYERVVDVPASWRRADRRVVLELGGVGDVAEVTVNGRITGIAWTPPYRVDVTEALRPGRNRIAVKVANTWQNRIVGDLQPGAAKVASTNAPAGVFALLEKRLKPDTPLTPSGLLGPIRLVAVDRGKPGFPAAGK